MNLPMRIVSADVGSRGADSLPYSQGGTPAQAAGLRAAGFDWFAGYLGAMNTPRLEAILQAGLAYSPVTFGGEYEDGADDEITQLRALGIPMRFAPDSGVTVWLDMEGLKAFKSDPIALAAKIDAWATKIQDAGYMPGLYVGVPQPFTSAELWTLKVRRYWKGMGSLRDRTNALAEPTSCGWCCTQVYPSVVRGGVLIDANIVGQDFKGRVPNLVAL